MLAARSIVRCGKRARQMSSATPDLDEFERLVAARYTCRHMDPKRPVPEDLLERICALTLVRLDVDADVTYVDASVTGFV